ncbi:MAG: S1 RNA-binding domain-containing protein, partial [Candidatus Heimdallarchaeota archaeon]|nr:S1 RNA-binding domain-containing protein [Candidatus Heimdallarchaeota archaeon]
EQALAQAKEGRMFIMERIVQTIDKPRVELSEFAPRITVIMIPQEKIKDIIGPGGKMIKKIIADTGVSVNVDDDGKVSIASTDGDSAMAAIAMVEGIIAEAEVGKIYQGKITRLMNFGAFCEILPGKEGLVHVSELSNSYVKNVEDVVKSGDAVTVKCIEVDNMGRINLSIKQAMPKEETDKAEEAA